jgi:hypothetical protein
LQQPALLFLFSEKNKGQGNAEQQGYYADPLQTNIDSGLHKSFTGHPIGSSNIDIVKFGHTLLEPGRTQLHPICRCCNRPAPGHC